MLNLRTFPVAALGLAMGAALAAAACSSPGEGTDVRASGSLPSTTLASPAAASGAPLVSLDPAGPLATGQPGSPASPGSSVPGSAGETGSSPPTAVATNPTSTPGASTPVPGSTVPGSTVPGSTVPAGKVTLGPEWRVVGGQVLIEAVASGDPATMLADLQRLGLEKGVLAGRIANGWLPLDNLAAAQRLATVQFIRAPLGTTN